MVARGTWTTVLEDVESDESEDVVADDESSTAALAAWVEPALPAVARPTASPALPTAAAMPTLTVTAVIRASPTSRRAAACATCLAVL